MKGISLQHRTYYARIVVPADVRAVIGKRELVASLKTDSFSDAKKAAGPIIAGFKAQIARARSATGVSPSADELRRRVQIALASWSMMILDQPPAREAVTPYEALDAVPALKRAVDDPDGWRQVPDFDARAVEALKVGGVRLSANQLGSYRQEIALTFLWAEKHRERERAINAAQINLMQTLKATLDSVLPSEPVATPSVRPSMTLLTLFERWDAADPPPDPVKDGGKRQHQIRRLVEFVSDKPANQLSKVEIEQFFRLVAFIPKRRTAELHAMPIQEVAERVKAANEREEEAAETEGRDPVLVTTITRKTAMLWFHSFQRMYRYAIRLELPNLVRNPFDGMSSAVKGDASIKRRGYTAEEITTIFDRLRVEGGAKRWLPILALFHGARLSELAAMPATDFHKVDGHWVFDLSNRKLKTQHSSRLIPLHGRAPWGGVAGR